MGIYSGLAERPSKKPRSIPYLLAILLAYIFEFVYGLFGIFDRRPLLTRLPVYAMGMDQNFPVEKAMRDFGYRQRVDFENGMIETMEWVRDKMEKKRH